VAPSASYCCPCGVRAYQERTRGNVSATRR
jgi:hypothetical protein